MAIGTLWFGSVIVHTYIWILLYKILFWLKIVAAVYFVCSRQIWCLL